MQVSFETGRGEFVSLSEIVGDEPFSILEESDGDIYFVVQIEGDYILTQLEGAIVLPCPRLIDMSRSYSQVRRFRRIPSTLIFTEQGDQT
jgi:hypothetical protein